MGFLSTGKSPVLHFNVFKCWIIFDVIIVILQVIHLKYHLPDSELQDFALKAIKMLQSNSSVNAHGLVQYS